MEGGTVVEVKEQSIGKVEKEEKGKKNKKEEDEEVDF